MRKFQFRVVRGINEFGVDENTEVAVQRQTNPLFSELDKIIFIFTFNCLILSVHVQFSTIFLELYIKLDLLLTSRIYILLEN